MLLGASSSAAKVTHMPEYLVVCCWRSIKEVSLLLGQLTQRAPLVALEQSGQGHIEISEVRLLLSSDKINKQSTHLTSQIYTHCLIFYLLIWLKYKLTTLFVCLSVFLCLADSLHLSNSLSLSSLSQCNEENSNGSNINNNNNNNMSQGLCLNRCIEMYI